MTRFPIPEAALDNRPFDKPYIFFRGDHFYPVNLRGDDDVLPNIKLNPGTTMVQDMTGRIVWRPQ